MSKPAPLTWANPNFNAFPGQATPNSNISATANYQATGNGTTGQTIPISMQWATSHSGDAPSSSDYDVPRSTPASLSRAEPAAFDRALVNAANGRGFFLGEPLVEEQIERLGMSGGSCSTRVCSSVQCASCPGS